MGCISKKIQFFAIVSTVLLLSGPTFGLSADCRFYLGENHHNTFQVTSVPPADPSAKIYVVDQNHIPMNAFVRFQPLGVDAPVDAEVIMSGQVKGTHIWAFREINVDGTSSPEAKIHYLKSGELKDDQVLIYARENSRLPQVLQ